MNTGRPSVRGLVVEPVIQSAGRSDGCARNHSTFMSGLLKPVAAYLLHEHSWSYPGLHVQIKLPTDA